MIPYDCHTGEQLILLLKCGNEGAFTEIYNRYWKSMFAVASYKLDDLHGAEELVHDIFADLWLRRQTIEINSSLPAYLATAVKYKVIDARHRRSRRISYEQKAGMRTKWSGNYTEQTIRFEELKERLAELVISLPEKSRLIYQLSREEGFSQKEIAGHIGISEKTVEYHLSRALKLLRIGLQQLFSLFFLCLYACLIIQVW